MNELERFYIVKDVYTDITKRIEDVGGELDMKKELMDCYPICGTSACHGGWLADHFQTKIFDGDRLFDNGRGALLDHLEFDFPYDLFVYLGDVWHNEHVECLFSGSDKSFNNDGTTTFPDIAKYMIQAFKKKADIKRKQLEWSMKSRGKIETH